MGTKMRALLVKSDTLDIGCSPYHYYQYYQPALVFQIMREMGVCRQLTKEIDEGDFSVSDMPAEPDSTWANKLFLSGEPHLTHFLHKAYRPGGSGGKDRKSQPCVWTPRGYRRNRQS